MTTQTHHREARTSKPDSYPARVPVADDQVDWQVDLPGYDPSYFVADVVIANDVRKNPRGWADPEEIGLIDRTIESLDGEVTFDDAGRPRNLHGRTGICGRGLLGRWGANFAADAIIVRPTEAGFDMLAIRRRDAGQWAIPGGMKDGDEEPHVTAARELHEETGVVLDLSNAEVIYRGYVDDRRNTDNAWMETVAVLVQITYEQSQQLQPKGGDDAAEARWLPINDETLASLYASHGELVRLARARLT